MLRYYPPAAQHKLGSPWIGPNQVVRQATGHTVDIQRDPQKPIVFVHHTVDIQRDPQKPIVFVHVDDLKLCPTPEDVKWSPDISTAKSLCASTVAFRQGSHVSDVASAPSVDVSGWEDVASHHSSQAAVGELDRPIDLTGHVLSPFFVRNMDSRFHSMAHLMCYRYAIANGQRTLATGIRKWSKHLVDFPTPKFVTSDSIQQWRGILMDIYSHLCLTDESFRASLIATGSRPFRLQCAQPWGYAPNDPDTSVLHHTAARADLISDIFIEVLVCAASNMLTASRWLGLKHSHLGTRRAGISLAEKVLLHTSGSSFDSQPLEKLDLRNTCAACR